jgi:hypothetical protein
VACAVFALSPEPKGSLPFGAVFVQYRMAPGAAWLWAVGSQPVPALQISCDSGSRKKRGRVSAGALAPRSNLVPCEFCRRKFVEASDPVPAGAVTTGYAAVGRSPEGGDDYYWVCDGCFADFRERFAWTIRS